MAATRPLNVLVYSGTGATAESVRHCLDTLRRLLAPHFAVQTAPSNILLAEPWPASTALLVFPGGADLGYCTVFNGDGNRKISQYVRRGGAFLGFCAGGYYGTKRCEFEEGNRALEVIGNRELGFFPGTARGAAFKGFEYGSEKGARAAQVAVKDDGGYMMKTYFNGGCVFVDAAKMAEQGVEVLAEYTEPLDVDGGEGNAAAVFCKWGEGCAVLTGTHPEFAAANLNRNISQEGYAELVDALAADEEARVRFMKTILSKLGLSVPEASSELPPLSDLHLTSIYPDAIGPLVERLESAATTENGQARIIGEADTFILTTSYSQNASSTTVPATAAAQSDATTLPGAELVLRTYPSSHLLPSVTPQFSHPAFYSALATQRAASRSSPSRIGSFLLYGETVTSTNVLLDRNPALTQRLPHGSVFTATTQVAGRGRGANVWLSPPGSLMFSIALTHEATAFAAAPVVFVQYLAALATVEAVRAAVPDLPVRLKWPNDIFAIPLGSGGQPVKIGGVLVNSSYADGAFRLIVGVGLNVANPAPTTSLNALLAPADATKKTFDLESTLARICVVFDDMYARFCVAGWSVFEDAYYRLWLHSGQIVTLETQGGTRARVLGITNNYGLLRVEEVGGEDGMTATGRVWELQSDGNSFDFFKGLLKRKT